jgi:hypothetical protein
MIWAGTISGTPHAFMTVLALCLLGFVIYLVRKRGLSVKYSMLWVVTALAMALLAIAPGILDWVADKLGITYAPALLFLFAILFLMAVCMHLSYEVSRLEERTRVLAERLAAGNPRSGGDTPG